MIHYVGHPAASICVGYTRFSSTSLLDSQRSDAPDDDLESCSGVWQTGQPTLLRNTRPTNIELLGPQDVLKPYRLPVLLDQQLNFFSTRYQDVFVPHELLRALLHEDLQHIPTAHTSAVLGNRLQAVVLDGDLLVFHMARSCA